MTGCHLLIRLVHCTKDWNYIWDLHNVVGSILKRVFDGLLPKIKLASFPAESILSLWIYISYVFPIVCTVHQGFPKDSVLHGSKPNFHNHRNDFIEMS